MPVVYPVPPPWSHSCPINGIKRATALCVQWWVTGSLAGKAPELMSFYLKRTQKRALQAGFSTEASKVSEIGSRYSCHSHPLREDSSRMLMLGACPAFFLLPGSIYHFLPHPRTARHIPGWTTEFNSAVLCTPGHLEAQRLGELALHTKGKRQEGHT